ncbi:MAG: protoporphyrinogen oxidase [Kiritimatiellae bacterium]|nr:protoporphyrinogen oxidase [Kiritimatiellia bacterium]
MTLGPSSHVMILGGGITGLATAYYLQKARPDVRYTLVEQSSRLGGKVTTTRENGFVIEGGPDSFITDKPWALQLCRDLGLEDRLIPSNRESQKVYLLRHGKLVQYPGGLRLAVPTKIRPFLKSQILSNAGKFRMLGDLFIPRRESREDESLASFIQRRFGHECLDRLAGPLMGGIYVSDPKTMSMESTFPSFIQLEREHRSLILGMKAAAKKRSAGKNPASAPPAMFMSLQGGMQELIEALVTQLKGTLKTSTFAKSVRRSQSRFLVELETHHRAIPVSATHVVVTLPAWEAARVLEPAHWAMCDMLQDIRYVSTATASLAYQASDLPQGFELDGFGVLIPEVENRRLIACTWSSTKFAGRAPEGTVLMRAFVGGNRHEADAELPDDELLELVRDEFKDLFKLEAPPMAHHISRWLHANPQYDVGHRERVDIIDRYAAEVPGLHIAGSAYRGIGLPDCIHGAIKTVEAMTGTALP